MPIINDLSISKSNQQVFLHEIEVFNQQIHLSDSKQNERAKLPFHIKHRDFVQSRFTPRNNIAYQVTCSSKPIKLPFILKEQQIGESD